MPGINPDKYAEYAYHGGPWDRGSADSYYRRPMMPHYWPSGTLHGDMVKREDMTDEEVEAYEAGYLYNEEMGDHKIWD